MGRDAPLGITQLYARSYLERLYGKSSNSGESPRHEADHGSVHHRFAARTKPLVVLAHPPLLVDPRQRTLHHPPTRQHQEAFGGHELAPIYRHALLRACANRLATFHTWQLSE